MSIVGGLDIHRKQITFDYPGTATGEVRRGQIAPADREHLAAWPAGRFTGQDAHFAVEGFHLEVLRRRLLEAARQLAGAKELHARLYGVGPVTALALCCWLGGKDRFSSTRKAVRFAGLDVTVYSSDGKRSPGHLSRQGPEVLRFSSALAVSGCIGVAFHRRSRRAGGAVVVPPLRLLSDARAGHGCGARHMDGLGSRCLAGERRRGGSPSAARTGMPAHAVGG